MAENSINKRAKSLRKNMTDAEQKLWQILRSRQLAGYKFRRQHPIGQFVADFACPQYHLIIEADGGQHAGNSYDTKRTLELNSQGWQVIRFWNNEILKNADGVTLGILEVLTKLKKNG